VHEAIGKRRIENDFHPAFRHELPVGSDGIALWRMHPAVDCNDPGCGNQSTQGNHQCCKQVQARAHALFTKQHDTEKARFEKECGENFISHQRTDNRTGLVGKNAPVGAELIGHDDAGNDTHAKGYGEYLFPEIEKVPVNRIFLPQP
jgi:hypothetical protein